MILLTAPQGTERDALRRQAEELRGRLLKGESFEMLAAQYSQGPTASAGGDIGYVERGQTLPELEEAAFRMAVGEISPVIELAQGLYLLKVVDKKGKGLKPFSEVRQEIVMKIEDEKMGQRFDTWIADLRKKSHIVVKL
jgi:parvulin-like peptidyl-prolyl isomerase